MAAQTNVHPIQILIADDEKAIRNGLHFLIKQRYRDIEVVEAANGQESWELLVALPQIKLAFMDIRMPGIDGLRVCERARGEDLSTRIVIISGFRDFEYARQALRYGVADYLLKPVNPSDVLRLVQEVVVQASASIEVSQDKQSRLIIESVRKWIHDHLHEEITLADLAEKLHYSASYLSALFKRETGRGFQEYLVDCRMQRARHLLLDPSLRITDIASQVGYTNAKAFSITFRKAYMQTPTEYRENRNIETPPST